MLTQANRDSLAVLIIVCFLLVTIMSIFLSWFSIVKVFPYLGHNETDKKIYSECSAWFKLFNFILVCVFFKLFKKFIDARNDAMGTKKYYVRGSLSKILEESNFGNLNDEKTEMFQAMGIFKDQEVENTPELIQ